MNVYILNFSYSKEKKQIFFKLIANYIRMEKTTTIKLLKSKQKIAYTYDNPLIASNPSTQLQRNIDVFFNT